MDFYVEQRNPSADLGGLCECFLDSREDVNFCSSPHVHQYFELLYSMEGSFDLIADQRTFHLHEGDAALVHPMAPHHTRKLPHVKNTFLVLKFTPEALYSVVQPMFELKYIFPYLHFSEHSSYVYTAEELKDSHLKELLFHILEERQSKEYGYEMAVRAYVSQVLLWFIRTWNRTQAARSVIDDRTLVRLQKSIQYIDEHMDEELREQDVAEMLDMGLSTFSRFFSTAAGMTFPAYVRSRRLSRASALLAQSDRSITDIALETGFSTASYLILCFRKQYGMTPHQFRRLCAVSHE